MNHRPENAADPAVSRAYHDLARETTPARLDAAVLDSAHRAARPPYARSRAWTRPLAWAATIALSVAVVLELTRTADFVSAPSPAARTVASEIKAADDGERRDRQPPSLVPGFGDETLVVDDRAAPEPVSVASPTVAEKKRQVMDAAAPAEFAESAASPASVPVSQPSAEATAAPAAAARLERENEDLLGRAHELATMQFGNNSESRAAGALESEAAGCPDDTRSDPGLWLECIEELEAAGLDAAADAQRELLEEAFPDFELP